MGLGFRVQGLGFRIHGSGFRVESPKLSVLGSEVKDGTASFAASAAAAAACGLGFRFQGLLQQGLGIRV